MSVSRQHKSFSIFIFCVLQSLHFVVFKQKLSHQITRFCHVDLNANVLLQLAANGLPSATITAIPTAYGPNGPISNEGGLWGISLGTTVALAVVVSASLLA